MRSKNIFSIHIEGPDGVGKSTLFDLCVKRLEFRYTLHDRGDLSNFVFAKKFGRFFCPTERHQSELIVYLYCDKDILAERIRKRACDNDWSDDDLQNELSKVDDVDRFEEAYKQFSEDDAYRIVKIDTTHMNPEQVFCKLLYHLRTHTHYEYTDDEISPWNKMYDHACKKLGLNFYSRDNQPYINDIPFMAESTNQNGVYEQFKEKSYPDNLIYMYGYDLDGTAIANVEKNCDFAYVINSKINRRPEVLEYFTAFNMAGLTCLVSAHCHDTYESCRQWPAMPRTFGSDFIKQLARAKATVYTGRDLAYLKLQTARLYEAIEANEIVFVDAESDVDNEILSQIYGESKFAQRLRVTPETIVSVYLSLSDDEVSEIIDRQHCWYENLKKTVNVGRFA